MKLFAALVLAAVVAMAQPPQASSPASAPALADSQPLPKTKAELETFVKDYLLRHPEVILQAVKQYQENERQAEKLRTTQVIQARHKQLFEDPTSPATMPHAPAEPVTIVEFFDYKCGYCKKVAPTMAKLIAESKIRLIYKELPILGPDSAVAAKAALAARKQGQYFDFHQDLMKVSGPITMAAIENLAAKYKLDMVRLKSDMEGADIQTILSTNEDLAGAIGVSATPSFVIGDELITGALDEAGFAEALAKVRKR